MRLPPKTTRPALFCTALMALLGAGLFAGVGLTPRIDENFFFSTDDPQLQGTREIDETFDMPPQIILAAEGDIYSRSYLTQAALLTEDLQALPGVRRVYSLGSGPGSVEGALKSPLWSRLVIARTDLHEGSQVRGSNFILILEKKEDHGELVEGVNALKARYDSSAFRLSITGGPFIVHEVQKKLVDDLKTFTIAVLVAFSAMMFLIFRSGWILLGAMVSACMAAFLDFLFLHLARLDPGPLSANLWSITFVLTLSHVVFISGNWESFGRANPGLRGAELAKDALRATGTASFWSMTTNSLGFLTLLGAAAKPIRQFGVAGLVGSVMAMLVAYTVFPVFLRLATPAARNRTGFVSGLGRRIARGRAWFAAGVVLLAVASALWGIRRVDTQPPIYSYFAEGSRLRDDLVRIDALGGASPFYLVVRDRQGRDFLSNESYLRLWNLQLALEDDPRVGEVVSLATLLGQVVESPVSPYLSWKSIFEALDLPAIGSPGRGFVSPDRKSALFVLRMHETGMTTSRDRTIRELTETADGAGYDTVLTGGLFELTGRLSDLVARSLLQGVGGLAATLFMIAWLVSRSLRVALAVGLTLVLVPICVLGGAGFLRLPLEIVSTPGVNLAMGLGVDETIHIIHEARGKGGGFDFASAVRRLGKPILASTSMLCVGFSTFVLSNFPPSRNLGLLVLIGGGVAMVVMLVIFPAAASALTGGLRWRAPPRETSELPRAA